MAGQLYFFLEDEIATLVDALHVYHDEVHERVLDAQRRTDTANDIEDLLERLEG